MTVSIQLSDDAEARLRARAAAAGQDVESFVSQVLADELAVEEIAQIPASVEDFGERLRQLIAGHGIRNGSFDDSRESIYAERGQ